jgi:hypothetical protein
MADPIRDFNPIHLPHADYPHEPGRLWGCEACEEGPCTCGPNDAPCISVECTNLDDLGKSRNRTGYGSTGPRE